MAENKMRLPRERQHADADTGDRRPSSSRGEPKPTAAWRSSVGSQTVAEVVTAVIQARRDRDRLFDSELFADPAWDILLELFSAQLAQTRVSTSELCKAAAVPATTALRWIDKLARLGWIDRAPDPLDGRRFFVTLSAKGQRAMSRYFSNSEPIS